MAAAGVSQLADRVASLARLAIPNGPEDVTPEWLTAALTETDVLRRGRVREARWERIGEQFGFTGVIGRIQLRYDHASGHVPGSLAVKLPMAQDEAVSGYRAIQQRDPERMRRYYERSAREARFYREIAPEVAPRPYYTAANDEQRRVILLLEDVSGGRQGNVLHGCSIDDAVHVIEELGPFHARWWGERAPRLGYRRSADDPRTRQGRYAAQVEPFLARYGELLPPAVCEIARKLGSRFADVAEALYGGPKTLTHGDLHLDNMIFDPPGDPRSVVVLDWQTVSVGAPAADVAFFLVDSLSVEDRRAAEAMLLDRYVTLLAAHGVRDYSPDDLRIDCDRALLLILAGTIGGIMTLSGPDLTERERALQESALKGGRLFAALLDHDAGARLADQPRR
jgi:Phosphotransferase enzyme family